MFPKRGKSKRGRMTKAQKEYIERCLADGCVICAKLGDSGTPAQWHHEKERWHGAGMRAPHEYGLPLCPWHHNQGPDSIHRNPKGFASLAGMTEAQLVDKHQRDYGWISPDQDQARDDFPTWCESGTTRKKPGASYGRQPPIAPKLAA